MSFVYSKMLVTVNHKKMTKFLNDKRILFISTKYYGYQKEILNGLREAGATVEFYYDDPFDYLSFINSRVLQPFFIESKKLIPCKHWQILYGIYSGSI